MGSNSTPAESNATEVHDTAEHRDASRRAAVECIAGSLRALVRDAIRVPGSEERGAMAVLSALREIQPVRPGDLAEHMGMDFSVISRQLNTLGEREMVTRVPDERDRRAVLVSLTPAGEEALDVVRARRIGVLEAETADLSADELVILAGLLDRMAEGIRDGGPDRRAEPVAPDLHDRLVGLVDARALSDS